MRSSDPVGIIDSGVGGLSVLAEIRKRLPREDHIYLADTVNAPYGVKSPEQILRFTEDNVDVLLAHGCKAIVIACNTATAVAIKKLRECHRDVPIVGLEPAIAPAVRECPNGNILVLATSATLRTERFKGSIEAFGAHKERIFCVSAQEIVSYVENGGIEASKLEKCLKERFKEYEKIRFSACVLGCTHFPFAKKEIEASFGYSVSFYDGACGAAKRLEYLLEKNGLLNPFGHGSVSWLAPKELEERARKLLCT